MTVLARRLARRRGLSLPVAAATMLAVTAARLPSLRSPLTPDEGGFLLVASQWRPSTSLYGDYWTDRPPVLIGIFEIAADLGGALPLRLIGLLATLVAVGLVAALTELAIRHRPAPDLIVRLAPILIVGICLSTPVFGTTMVDGELLAVPFVLGGVLLAVVAARATSVGAAPTSVLPITATGAGLLGGLAVCVKQNVVDVAVFVVVLVIQLRVSGRGRAAVPGRVGLLAGGVAIGFLVAVGGVVGLAAVRGTEPGALWQAVVTFRADAAAVISASAPEVNEDRMQHLLARFVTSGMPIVLGVLAWRLRRAAEGPTEPGVAVVPDLRWPALALLVWETVGVVAGGSYWSHYLIGLVPGMALVAVAATQRVSRRTRVVSGSRLLVAAFAVSGAALVTALLTTPPGAAALRRDAEVVDYLEEHGTDGDSIVVGFGHPNIVWDAGLQSPYEQLWSLPVRVRDPRLGELSEVLAGPGAPTWVVVRGDSLATWGVSAHRAEAVLTSRYRLDARVGGHEVWRLRS